MKMPKLSTFQKFTNGTQWIAQGVKLQCHQMMKVVIKNSKIAMPLHDHGRQWAIANVKDEPKN